MSRFDNNCLWITRGLDDRISVASLVHIVRGDGDLGHARFPHSLEPDGSDVSSDFDLVQLFH